MFNTSIKVHITVLIPEISELLLWWQSETAQPGGKRDKCRGSEGKMQFRVTSWRKSLSMWLQCWWTWNNVKKGAQEKSECRMTLNDSYVWSNSSVSFLNTFQNGKENSSKTGLGVFTLLTEKWSIKKAWMAGEKEGSVHGWCDEIHHLLKYQCFNI